MLTFDLVQGLSSHGGGDEGHLHASRDVVNEVHEHRDGDDGEDHGATDRDGRHKLVPVIGTSANRAEDEKRVDERTDEAPQRQLAWTIAHEVPEHARRILRRRQLQRDDGDGKDDADDRDRRGGDRRQETPRPLRPATEYDRHACGEIADRVVDRDQRERRGPTPNHPDPRNEPQALAHGIDDFPKRHQVRRQHSSAGGCAASRRSNPRVTVVRGATCRTAATAIVPRARPPARSSGTF